jgi:transposase
VDRYCGGGRGALKARPVPGRPPGLSGAQLQRVDTLVVGDDPRQLQFTFALWTRAMVRELIRREFAVRLSEVSVGRLLRKLGLSPQRPLDRAYQQNPEAVARWKAETYPAIRAEADRVGATISRRAEASRRTASPPRRRLQGEVAMAGNLKLGVGRSAAAPPARTTARSPAQAILLAGDGLARARDGSTRPPRRGQQAHGHRECGAPRPMPSAAANLMLVPANGGHAGP